MPRGARVCARRCTRRRVRTYDRCRKTLDEPTSQSRREGTACEQHDADTAEHERAANTGNARIARVVRERTAACAEARVDHTRRSDAATAHADDGVDAAGATISKASLSVSAPPRPAGQMLDASHAHNHPRQRKVPRKAREA